MTAPKSANVDELRKEFKGKVRGSLGDLTDDRSEQIKGKAEELKGKVQRKIGERQSDVDRDF